MLSWQEEASFITGVHLPVDGGLTIQLQDDFARKVLDHHTAAEITEALLTLAAGRTLIVATHDPVLAARMDRVIHLAEDFRENGL